MSRQHFCFILDVSNLHGIVKIQLISINDILKMIWRHQTSFELTLYFPNLDNFICVILVLGISQIHIM